MENASRMLIIAATTLLAILLISLFVSLFNAGSKVSETYDLKQQMEQLELYNSKFELYNKSNNTIIDIVSVANLAYSVNAASEFDPSSSVNIIVRAGNTTFSIPNGTDGTRIDRNQILVAGAGRRSVYDLIDTPLRQLGVTTSGAENADDKLSTTAYVSATTGNRWETIYKYLFNCIRIEYNGQNGKVSLMEFRLSDDAIEEFNARTN